MAGKGSRQRTYGSAFNTNYDRIFGKNRDDEVGTEWVAEETTAGAPRGSQKRSKRPDSTPSQYPQEAREGAQRGTEEPSEDAES